MEHETVYQKARQGGASDETIMKEHVADSMVELAHTIATMTEGILRTHGIFCPMGTHTVLEGRAQEFLEETNGIQSQIEAQIVQNMSRPTPPAA